MSIQSEITRLTQAKQDIIAAITAKGVTVPADSSLEDLTALVQAIETGSDPVLQSKTVTPTTSKQTVTPDSGYDGLSDVTVNAMESGAMSDITVSSSGVITSRIDTSGYLASGTEKTMQLNTQRATTITPSRITQTAVPSGRYTTGAVKVIGDSNLIAANIRSGIRIFGVPGSYEGSGGSGGGSVETCTVTIEPLLYDIDYEHTKLIVATVLENGDITPYYEIFDGKGTQQCITIENVVCGSAIYVGVRLYSNSPAHWETDGGATLLCSQVVDTGYYNVEDVRFSVFRAPKTQGAIGSMRYSYEP